MFGLELGEFYLPAPRGTFGLITWSTTLWGDEAVETAGFILRQGSGLETLATVKYFKEITADLGVLDPSLHSRYALSIQYIYSDTEI